MNNFLRASIIRAIRTIAQTAVATISSSAVLLSDVSWTVVLSASVLAGILSILTSIATGLPEVEYQNHIYMSREEPEDSEVTDGEE